MENKGNNIEKLNNENYFAWKYKMEMLLIKEEVWDVIKDEGPTNPRTILRWQKRDDKARALIGLSVENNQLVHIRDKNSALLTWNSLKQAHEKDTLTTKISIYKKIALHRMQIGGNAEQHINEMSELFQRLKDLGASADEEWMIGMLFALLPKTYSTLVTALEARAESDLTWNMVQSKILDEFERQQDNPEFLEEKILSIKKDRMHCYFCRRDNHQMKDWFKLKQYREFEQLHQGKEGKENPQEKLNEIKEENNDEKEELEELILTISEGIKKKNTKWILDSGSPLHICTNKKQFKYIESLSKEKEIKIPNGDKITVKEQGTCEITCLNAKGKKKKLVITEVLFVPEIKVNILSILKLTKHGMEKTISSHWRN